MQETMMKQLPLEEIFSTSTAKILDFLLMNNGLNYTENDITSLTDIQPRTFSRVMQILVQQKLVKRTRNNRTYHYAADRIFFKKKSLLMVIASSLFLA